MKIKKITVKKQDITFPDIDLDFAGDRRQNIIDYLINKYGADQVALVGTQLVYSAKSALRDLGQVYEIPAPETQKCSKDYNDNLSVEENIRTSKHVAEFFKKHPEIRDKVDKIVGVISSLGIHAGGVVITDKKFPIKRYCALQRSKEEGRVATLWTKEELQPIGIVKYDILGLTTAGQNHIIKQMVGDDPYTDYAEDSEVYRDIVLNCKHKNIFQFESQLGRKAFEDLKPMSFMELSNASGIIRVLGSEEGRDVYRTYAEFVSYVQQGDSGYWKEKIREEVYEDNNYNAIIKVLGDSYGILIYQEQLANLIKEISGGQKTFTDGNKVRKALETHSKKFGNINKIQGNKDALKQWHAAFMAILDEYLMPYLGRDGYDTPNKDLQNFLKCKLNANNELPIPKFGIIKWFITAAAYLFSKLHSVAYTMNTYNAMYLKHYHPLQFWTGSLVYEQNDLDKVKAYISAIQLETEIKILPPDINKSNVQFGIEGQNIRYGMGGIMNVGDAANVIILERRANGKYKSIADLFKRVDKKYLNKRVLEALLYVNALSDFGDMATVYDELVKLGGNLAPLETDTIQLSLMETKYLGVAITNVHPLVKQASGYVPITFFEEGDKYNVCVYILEIKKKTTKNNKPYTMFKCQCLNSFETFNVFDWSNNKMDFKKGAFEIMHVKKANNFHQLVMSKNFDDKKKKNNNYFPKGVGAKLKLKVI